MVKIETIGNIETYTVKNGNIEAEFISYGARMTKLIYNGIDVLLGYDKIEDYLSDTLFIGATVGRFAGRIGSTELILNGKEIHLDRNENGTTCHHGGYNAYDKRFWSGQVISENSVCFTRTGTSGEGGFPGNLEISVYYTVLENGVEISHSAKTDEATFVNLANHAYFNLSGYQDPDAREMHLLLPSDHYLALNEKLIPTGTIEKSAGTKFDFSKFKKIQTDLDHYFIYREENGIRYGGSLYSDITKILMKIETDQPGIQIYTCGAFEADRGKGGIPLHLNQGIALETQGFPDSPNHPSFPSCIITPETPYRSTTRFIFSAEIL